jgi:hypothetical protein
MRIILIAAAFVLSSCAQRPSDLEQAAMEAVAVRESGEIETHQVTGVREDAVCGTVGTKRFVYRPSLLVIEDQVEWNAIQFQALWEAWEC